MEKGRISLRQFLVMVFLFTLGDAILVLPAAVIYPAKQDAWISGLISLVVGAGIIFLFYKVGNTYPEKSFVEIMEAILGKWFGKVVAIAFIAYTLLSVGVLLRELGAFFLTHYLKGTPMQVVMALFIITVALAVRLGVEIVGRSAEIFLPWVLATILISVTLLLGKIDIKEMFPIYENGPKPILKGSIQFIAFPFLEIVPLLMFKQFVTDQKLKYKHLFFASFLGGFVLFVATFMAIVILGPYNGGNVLYPTLKLAQEIKVGAFIQRMDILVATFWLFTIFFKMTFYLYATTMGISQIFKVKEFRFIVFPLAFLAIPVALNSARDIVDLNEKLIQIWPFFDFTIGLVIPLFLLIVWKIKQKRKKQTVITQ